MILCEVSGRGLLRDEQFRLKLKHSTAPQLARLVERVSRNFNERRMTGEVFLDMAKAFDTVWIVGLLYKLTVLIFPSYLVKTVSSYLKDVRSKRPSKQPHPLVVACGLE